MKRIGFIKGASLVFLPAAAFFLAAAITGFCSSSLYPQSRPENEQEKTLNAEITLGDSRKVTGTIRVNAPDTMTVRHLADGLYYEKNIRITDIKTVEILKWKGTFIRESSAGRIFDFFPSEYAVVLQDGFRMIRTEDFFPFLSQVTLENEKGKLALFTYWRDLKGTDGKWFTGSESSDTVRSVPHKDVVRSFTFRITAAGDHE